MSTEDNKTIVRRYFEEAPTNPSTFDQVVAPDVVFYMNGLPGPIHGIDSYRQLNEQYRSAFPDFSFKVDELIAEGDRVCVRYTLHGTHKGTFQGIPATNKSFTTSGLSLIRVRNGKIAEDHSEYDALSAFQQLGLTTVPLATSGSQGANFGSQSSSSSRNR